MKRETTNRILPGLLKGPGTVILLSCYLAVSLVLTALPVSADEKRRSRIRLSSFFSRLALSLFRIRVLTEGRELLDAIRRKGGLVVANHVSYVDVLALSALMPAVFITSVELKNTPLLGMLARSGGSLFVERRKASGLKREIEAIAGLLSRGYPVVLFPEATTSNGDRVQPFKRSLFDAAVAARADVFPLCLRYTRINGRTVTASNRDNLYYYGGAAFSSHFPAFLRLACADLEITLFGPVSADAASTRKDLAEQAYDLISREYGRTRESVRK